MIFSLDVRRARKGDCLLLHTGTKKRPGLVMIDGGPPSVYLPHLKPRIDAIRKARKLKDEESLPVDALMVSHVDDDHIRGILELGKAESERKQAHQPQTLNVLSLWHNSFDEVIKHNTKEITAAVNTQFPTAAAGKGELPDDQEGRGRQGIPRASGSGRERAHGSRQHRAGFPAAADRRLPAVAAQSGIRR